MNKLNKYGYIHGGYSYFRLDEESSKLAIETIGESMTANASIFYHKPLLSLDDENIECKVKVISQTKNTVNINGEILQNGEICVTGIFTFVRIK